MKALVELDVGASVIESPLSDLKLEALGVDREAMLERIVYAISFAVEQGITVAFFGVDGTRADPSYFETVYKTAVEAGAHEVVVVDTIGIATPEAVADLVGRTREWLGADRPIHFHGHNDFGVATAAAVAAVRAGANWIQGTVNGMGERAGNANLPEIALALRGLYGVETNDSAGSRGMSSSPTSPSSARTSSGGSRARSPASSTIRRRSSRIPRSSSGPSAASCSGRRAASTRSESRRRSSGSSWTKTRSAICWHV